MGLIELTLILEHTKKWSKLGQRRNEKNSDINKEKKKKKKEMAIKMVQRVKALAPT